MDKMQLPVFCDTCGGTLKYSADGLSARCPYCGNEYNFKNGRSEALALALSRANAYRMNCDFDEAITEYKLITDNNPEEPEAYWGIVLSTYGIEFVQDPSTGTRIPTCRRIVRGSILQDENYLKALKFADDSLADSYREKASAIDRLQRDIKRRMEEEESFDVFLCFRSADENGAPTRERTVSRRIYDELSRRKIRTFFSEETLKGRLGEDFEPVIFKALYSCKFFILVAASEESINSPWVKNEWSRFRERVYDERLSGACCAVFEGITCAALPSFLRTQGVNLAKYPAGGYEIEIADNLQLKFFGGREKTERNETAYSSDEINELIAEGQDALSRGDFIRAAASFSKAIDEDGDCGEAWLGAFMAEVEIRAIKSETKLAQEINNRLWSAGSTSAECRQRLAANEHILYAFSSPYYKNSLKYCTSGTASTLVKVKRSVMDMADKCNASLKLCLEECVSRENAQKSAAANTDVGADGYGTDAVSAAATLAGAAAAGGVLGYLFGRRRVRPFMPPPPGPRRMPPRGPGGFGHGGGPRPGGGRGGRR